MGLRFSLSSRERLFLEILVVGSPPSTTFYFYPSVNRDRNGYLYIHLLLKEDTSPSEDTSPFFSSLFGRSSLSTDGLENLLFSGVYRNGIPLGWSGFPARGSLLPFPEAPLRDGGCLLGAGMRQGSLGLNDVLKVFGKNSLPSVAEKESSPSPFFVQDSNREHVS